MICGALQTLNEEAFEDVASSERPSPSGLPTGEMLAAAAQLQLAPICETSEFGSPSDEQMVNNLLQYNNNNNTNNNNNSASSNSAPQSKYQNAEYSRSASSHSLQSLNAAAGAAGASGGLQMRLGNANNGSADLINVVSGGNDGCGGSGNAGGGGEGGYASFYNPHSLTRVARPSSIANELLIEPMTPYMTVPMVVVVPNSDNIYDDTKL